MPCDDVKQDALIGDFREFTRKALSQCDSILEIGPSHSPVLPRRMGYRTDILDHADAQTLRAKYSALGQDVSQIEDVDFVWTGQDLADLCQKRYSAIFASHVIEHVTDFLGTLKQFKKILADNGSIILIVPDKLYSFDLLQPLTDSAKVIADHHVGRSTHTFEAFFREINQVVSVSDEITSLTWGKHATCWRMKGSWNDFFTGALTNATSSAYIDAHEYYFTPSSFRQIILDLQYFSLIDLDISILSRSRGHEFLVELRGNPNSAKIDPASFFATKLALNRLLIGEHQEAFKFLI